MFLFIGFSVIIYFLICVRSSIIDFSIGIQSLDTSVSALEMVVPKLHVSYCFPILLDRF